MHTWSISLTKSRPRTCPTPGSFLLARCPSFLNRRCTVVVIDPGVGTDRAILCVDIDGCQLIGPDNGFWCALSQKLGSQPRVYRIDCQRWQLPKVSNTFHGRDRMAPAAARLSLGYAPESLGERTQQWCQLENCAAEAIGSEVHGKIIFIDGFGNLITNISPEDLEKIDGPFEVEVAGTTVQRTGQTYAEVPPGTPIALFSSFNLLEIAICQGNAELSFSVGVGACVVLRKRELTG